MIICEINKVFIGLSILGNLSLKRFFKSTKHKIDNIIKGITRFIPVSTLRKFPKETPNKHKLKPIEIL